MARYAAIFENNDGADAIREKFHAAHLAYLERNRDKVLIGGALRPSPDEASVGGLWVIEAASRDEAVRLCEGDPFFSEGLRKSYRLLLWGKAFADRPVTL